MVTAAQAITWYDPWIGYRDNGGAKIWALDPPPNWPGSAWCGATQGVNAYELGLPASPTTFARIIYVPYVVIDAKKAGKWITSYKSHPGDWVCFDWLYSGRRDGLADHIGMIIHNDPSLPYVYTIEGNTTDENGVGPRGVFVRRRYRVDILGCVDRQSYYTGTPTPIPVPIGPIAENQDLNKWVDVAHIKKLQTVLKVEADGVAGKITYTALQNKLGTTADGVLSGPVSRAVVALQQRIGLPKAEQDGILGPKTGSTLSSYLDKGGDLTVPKPPPTPKPPTPTPTPTPAPKPKPPYAKLTVDGIAGSATVKALQKHFKSKYVDGTISGQDVGWHRLLPADHWTTIQWQKQGSADGSTLIVLMQKALKVKADGIVGPKTAKSIQRWVGTTQDGILGVNSVKALQRKLNSFL